MGRAEEDLPEPRPLEESCGGPMFPKESNGISKQEYFATNANDIGKINSYTCSVNDSPWIKITKITIIIASFCINQFTRVCSGSLRKRKKKQFFVQEFSADREFHELTRQGSKLDVL